MAIDRGPEWSIQDKNQSFALIGHSGTAGTATTKRIVVTDGAVHVTGASAGTVVHVKDGTISDATIIGGTIGNLVSGSVVVTAGTVETTIGDLTGGTIDNLASGSIVVTAGTIGDLDTIGTIGVVESGSIVVTKGTVAVGTTDLLKAGTITKLEGGTLGLATRVGNLGTIENGTVGILAFTGTAGTATQVRLVAEADGALDVTADSVDLLKAGTLDAVNNLVKGTITSVQGGTIGNLASGSVVVTAGTVDTTLVLNAGTIDLLKAGTITKVEGGTVGLVSGVGTVGGSVGISNLAAGTITKIEGGTIGVIGLGTVNVTSGSIVQTAGTITTQLAGTQELLGTAKYVGTVGVVNAGSMVVTSGTIAAGTVKIDPTPPTYITAYGTLFGAAGSAFATISAASGEGTYHYVSGVSIVMVSGTQTAYVLIGTSLNGTGVLAAGNFPPGGGIARPFTYPLRSSGTNSEICCELAGAGTAYFTADFWRGT